MKSIQREMIDGDWLLTREVNALYRMDVTTKNQLRRLVKVCGPDWVLKFRGIGKKTRTNLFKWANIDTSVDENGVICPYCYKKLPHYIK